MEDVKMFLFARWMATCYAETTLNNLPEELSVLNIESGTWWKERLKYFNNIVYPNYLINKTVEKTSNFLQT